MRYFNQAMSVSLIVLLVSGLWAGAAQFGDPQAASATSGAAALPAIADTVPITSTITVTPTVTNRGGLITVSGSNFGPSERITMTMDGVSAPLEVITATAQGALPPTGVSIPYSVPAGAHTLRVAGANSAHTATSIIMVQHLAPAISLNLTTVSPGTTVTVSGSGFGRQEQITLALNGAAILTAPPVITTTNGSFTANVTVLDSLLRGLNTISAIGNESRVSAITNVTGIRTIAATLYFAGASTMPGEHATLPILNPNAQPVHINLTFFYQSGPPGAAKLDVPPHSRGTADLNALAGGSSVFGVKLVADRSVTAELHISRDGKDGIKLLGTTAPATTWYLAEGYTGLTFHETLALVNPGEALSQVQLRLLPFGGRAARTVEVAVAPQSTHMVDINSLMPHQSLSIIASASQPILVARILTFSNQGFGMTAKAGTNTPATNWIFAEGTTTTRFQTFLTILNPNTVGVLVTASFYGQTGGSLGSRTIYVAPLSRANLRLNDFLNASGIASVVTSNLPVVVERPEYFGGPNDNFVAGSVVFGRNGAGLNWAFPGGDINNRNEYLLIYNPSPSTVAIDATFYGSDGAVVKHRLYVPPTVRYNVNVNTLAPGLSAQHSITLNAVNGLGFIAEQTVFAPDYSALSSTQGFAQ